MDMGKLPQRENPSYVVVNTQNNCVNTLVRRDPPAFYLARRADKRWLDGLDHAPRAIV
jgi:hypothetical protein